MSPDLLALTDCGGDCCRSQAIAQENTRWLAKPSRNMKKIVTFVLYIGVIMSREARTFNFASCLLYRVTVTSRSRRLTV